MATGIITQGIGPGGSIPLFLLLGLAAEEEDYTPSSGRTYRVYAGGRSGETGEGSRTSLVPAQPGGVAGEGSRTSVVPERSI